VTDEGSSNTPADAPSARPPSFVRGLRDPRVLERLLVGLAAFVLWTEMDIAGVPLYPQRAAYNSVWYLALFGFLLILAVAYRTLALPFGLWVLSVVGGEDALYFYLRGRAVPARLPWLDGHAFLWQPPTDVSITAGLVLGLGFLLGVVLLERWLLGWWELRRTPPRTLPAL
jgi:hypothetical protein